ncbi:TonB-linked outer membrane protein, SusC/RagA family [Sphingobacterium spiritivorum]|uniref:TonB-linked outer membrane protein, SusC/RagA family n=1 Tax=Sphingobacterium spiritivorum TaxID=258 RepID=A0A380CPL2_SPHSI|nr:carboxypeptidase-like regulatory domain-containing protein [Sphingobacterium spiritivorum]SUJ24411.1 TonB-linked outer membrane protein, SusC/RagA family [Sphingobacterium spiritivorum]
MDKQLHLTGVVIDALTSKPIEGVTVKLSNTQSVSTNKEGHFSLSSVPANWELTFSAVGYKKQLFPMSVAQGKKVLVVRMDEEEQRLDEVVVNAPRKRKYSNKNNPAVDLIRKSDRKTR